MSFSDQNTLDNKVAIPAQNVSANGTVSGVVIDTQDAESINFAVQVGAATDGSFAAEIYESDDAGMAGATKIDAANVEGNGYDEAVAAAANEVYSFQIARTMSKRYVRLDLVVTGVSTGFDAAALCIKGDLAKTLTSDKNPT